MLYSYPQGYRPHVGMLVYIILCMLPATSALTRYAAHYNVKPRTALQSVHLTFMNIVNGIHDVNAIHIILFPNAIILCSDATVPS
jgi:hypothetical protein